MSLSSPDISQDLLDAQSRSTGDVAENASPLNRLSRGAMWVTLGRGLGIISTVLATILVPRLLAPQEFGELTSLLSVISFSAIVAQAGLGHSCVRLLSESLALGNFLRLRTALRLASRVLAVSSLVTGGLAVLAIWNLGISFFQVSVDLWVVLLAAVLILLMAWQQFSAESLRGLHELRWASLLSGGTFGGPLPVLLFLICLTSVAARGRPTLGSTLLCQVLGSGVSLAVCAFCLQRTLRRTTAKGPMSPQPELAPPLSLRDLLHVCLPMAVFQFFVIVMQTADIWMAAYNSIPQEVALYGAARRYLILLQVPLQLTLSTVVASIPYLYAHGMKEKLQTLLRRAATLTALATLLISPVCLLGGGWLMGSLSGVYYQQAGTALALLSLGQIFVSLTGCGGMTLAMTGRQTAAMWVCLVSVLFLCLAGPLAACWGGITGIAAASAAASTLQAVLDWLVCRRLLGIWTHADLRPKAVGHVLAKLFASKSVCAGKAD